MKEGLNRGWIAALFIILVLLMLVGVMVGERSEVEKKKVIFRCSGGKSIEAVFYIGEDRQVDLFLSDGRRMTVPRAISASGARYATKDELFVFWNKGDTAFITEGEKTTYTNCTL